MNLDINDIPEMSFAELCESEAAFTKDAEDFYSFTINTSRRAEDEKYYQSLIELRDYLRAEISRRKERIDNLSDLTILELRNLETVYDKEADKWHDEIIRDDYAPVQQYNKYIEEAKNTRNQIRKEIEKRLNFLDGLAKLTMAELALSEPGYNKDCEKFYNEATNSYIPSESKKNRRKYDVKCEARDMLRAEIVRRRQKI